MQFWRLLGAILVLAILLAPSAFQGSGLFDSNAASPSPSGVLNLTIVGKPYSLNQRIASLVCSSCWQIISLENAFGMPVFQNGSLNTQAGLFDWITTNSNASVWDFNIRPNARWSDDASITSADIVFTFGLSSRYLIGTPYDYLHFSSLIQNVSEVNASETQFVLNETRADFGQLLSSQYYFAPIPEHVWTTKDFNSDNNFAQDVSSGPYYHLNYTRGPNLVLAPNPYYWNGPGLDEINVTFVNSSSDAASMLLSNHSDVAQIAAENVSSFVGNPDFAVRSELDRSLLYMEYDVTQWPFNNTDFRQALAYAINTSSIAQDVYAGYATPGGEAPGTIPPSSTLWHNASDPTYSYSVTLAKQLLSSAGYTWSSSNSLLYPNGTSVSFKIYTDTDVSTDPAAAEMVAQNLKALGISVSVVPTSLANITADYYLGVGDIKSQIVIASSDSSIFGVGPLDIRPGYDVYFPWLTPRAHWLMPVSADSQYLTYSRIVNSTTNATEVESAVKSIDSLNARYLPMIVLAYPYDLWVYRIGTQIGGFPGANSSDGFGMGNSNLDPVTFSGLSCTGSCPVPITVTTRSTYTSTSVTTTATAENTTSMSSSSTSTSTTTPIAPPNNSNEEIITAVVIVFVIALGTVLARRRKPKPPFEEEAAK
jgi:ABC-type transport system substrate-binding protein